MKEEDQKVLIAAAAASAIGIAGLLSWRHLTRSKQVPCCWCLLLSVCGAVPVLSWLWLGSSDRCTFLNKLCI